MSDLVKKRMISAYMQESAPTPLFSRMFQVRPENVHSSEEVEIDVVRSQEDVAIVVQDLSAGYRANSTDLYTNKSFKPPVFKESIAINSHDLIKRLPGSNPFENPDFRAGVVTKMMMSMRKIEQKIRRSIELQASQVLQTGAVTLTDSNGVALYSLNYAPKASHFPTSGVDWNGGSATLENKLNDLISLSEVIRSDGLADPNVAIFGADAFENLLQTSGFLGRFDAIRADLGAITDINLMDSGAQYRGVITLGNYKLDLLTYNGRYTDPQTGVSTPYMDPGKVIIMSSNARLDATFGAIPHIGSLIGAGQRLFPEMPTRFTSISNGIDMFTNIWLTPDGEQLMGGVGTRPLMIPTAIDSFGCLDTQI
jgi:hypothetical protein